MINLQIIEQGIPFTVAVYYDKGTGGNDEKFEVEGIAFEGFDFTNLLSQSTLTSITEKAWEKIK